MKNNKGQKKEPIISNKQRRSYLKRFLLNTFYQSIEQNIYMYREREIRSTYQLFFLVI